MLRPKDSKLIIEKFFNWVVEKIILFILKSCYYITEGQYPNYGFQVFYFKKNEWQRKKTVALGSLSKKNVKIEPRESHYFFPKTPLIRFIPKGKGVRPLIAIGNGCLSNEELTHSRLLVEHLLRKRKYNTFSLSFADAWQSYVTKLEEISVSSPLYYVRTDIKGAFDSISHEKLLELLWEQIEELPQTLRFEQYMCEMGRNVRKKYICLENKRENEEELMRRKGFSLLNRQLIINPQRIFYKIKDYVMNQFFREGKNLFSLICGLAQGGKLSFHLSDLYYSTMLETYFDDYSNETSMLVKKADDILFVSVLHKEAEKFLGRIQSGIPEFNCIINEAKTSHNVLERYKQRIVFNGVVVCLHSRELLVNVCSLANRYPRYTLTLNCRDEPDKFVETRLKQVSAARLTLEVLNPAYTTHAGIVKNVWRTGVMAGARLIPLWNVVLVPRGPVNGEIVAKTVLKVGKQMFKRVEKTFECANAELYLCKEVILVAYISGVYWMLRSTLFSTWVQIRCYLEGYLRMLRQAVPHDQSVFLPNLLL